jgi:hypothetical protein
MVAPFKECAVYSFEMPACWRYREVRAPTASVVRGACLASALMISRSDRNVPLFTVIEVDLDSNSVVLLRYSATA